MTLSRREALAALAGAGLLVGCSRVAETARNLERAPMPLPTREDDLAVATLNRFGFGPSRQSLAQFRDLGPEQWWQIQLNPTDEEPDHLTWMISRMETQHLSAYELRDFKEEVVLFQMQQAAILRATYSPWQLRERMVDFWTNHFNINARKGIATFRKPQDEKEVSRAHALGKFPQMVMASAKSTAMLVYLDQQNSNETTPNENYARELLELHTLGVEGGYTQQDVMEVARCFTGWTEERGLLRAKGRFLFREDLHDDGEKIVLGTRIPAGGGVRDGERVVSLVSRHPATAKHVGGKLGRFFLGDDVSPKVLAKIEKTFLDTEGDIPAVMTVIHGAFPAESGPVMKRPFDYMVSAMRALDASTDAAKPVQDALSAMGQPLYQWPMPDGYPVEAPAWTGSLMGRWKFADALAHNRLQGTSVDLAKLTSELAGHAGYIAATHHAVSAGNEVANLLDSHELAAQVALALSAPEMQWR